MKKFLVCLLTILLLSSMVGCNKTIIDTTYRFDKAILSLPDGSTVSGDIEAWADYSDSDQIQVKIEGTTYLVHSCDIVLIND